LKNKLPDVVGRGEENGKEHNMWNPRCGWAVPCRLPVYVGKRGAPKGNRNAERDGYYNRVAKARRAQYSAVLKSVRSARLRTSESAVFVWLTASPRNS
jgi:hypothetical protein